MAKTPSGVFVIFEYQRQMPLALHPEKRRKMLKNIRLKISSVIENLDDAGLISGEAERTDFTADGEYGLRGGIAKISYTEHGEGGDTLCRITVKDGLVSVKRTGAAEVEMQFSEGERYQGIYSVPPFSFDMEITTQKITVACSENGAAVTLLYVMNIGGQKKRCKFVLKSI